MSIWSYKDSGAPVPVTHNDTLNRDAAGNHSKLLPAIDSTTAIQLADAAGNPLVNVDTTNHKVQLGYLANDTYLEADTAVRVRKTNLIMPKEQVKGIMIDPDTPVWGWKDLVGQIIPREGGSAAPVFTSFRGGLVRYYAFGAGDTIDNITYHMPHDWVPETDLYLHVHWGHNGTAISGNLIINWVYIYSKGYNQAGEIFGAEKTITQTIPITSIATHPRWSHNIDEFKMSVSGGSATQLDTDKLEVDGLIGVALNVTTIPTITGSATSNLPYIFMVDIHYQSNGLPTRNRNIPFYS